MNLPMRLLLASAVMLLAACATTSSGGRGKAAENPEEVITERALERWASLIKRDPATAWNYLSPGYRSTHPQKKYAEDMSNRPVRWGKVEAYVPDDGTKTVECVDAASSCSIRLKVHFKIASHLIGVGNIESWNVVRESWIKIKGQWYMVPEDVVR